MSEEQSPDAPLLADSIRARWGSEQITVGEFQASGLGKYKIDRSTHPGFYVSSWPVGYGHTTLHGKERYRLPHLSYNSVLVIVLSNEYSEGSWHRLQDMLYYTEEAGYSVALEEMDDMSTMPADAIGIMRACASMLALDAGVEWCLMVDTDVLLEKDTLVRLLEHDRPIVFPYLDNPNDLFPWGMIASPALKPNMGLQRVVWAAMSCMLFNTKVFNCLDHYAWHGHDFHFSQSLNHYGHCIMVDTDTSVTVVRGPSRHPSKSWGELWEGMKKAHDNRVNGDRDRGPPPDFDPVFGHGVVDMDGVYWAREKLKYGGARQLQPYLKHHGDGPDATLP